MDKDQYDYQNGQDAWDSSYDDPTLWGGGDAGAWDAYGEAQSRYDAGGAAGNGWGGGRAENRSGSAGPEPWYDAGRGAGDDWGGAGNPEDWGDFSSYVPTGEPPFPAGQRRPQRRGSWGPLLVSILAGVLVLALLVTLIPRHVGGSAGRRPAPAAPVPTVSAPATPAPATPVPATPAPATPAPATPAPATSASATPVPATPTPAPTPDPAAAFTGDRSELYFRSLLDPSEQLVYDAMCAAVAAHEEKAEGLLVSDEDRLPAIYDLVWRDRPEYFWIDGSCHYTYSQTENGVLADFYPGYRLDPQQCRELQQKVDAVRDQLTARFRDCSEYEKALGVYEYLIDSAGYRENPLDFGMCAVLTERSGVCTSYAKATQYLLQQLGVQALLVSGDAGGEKHVWNIVRIDGRYYQLDTTWGDPVMDDGSQQKSFCYFCLTDAEMLRDHFPENPELYPACTATEANWFRHEGRLIDRYDEAWLADRIRKDWNAGLEVSFRCTDEGLYRQYCRELFENDGLFRILKDMGLPQTSYYYMTNDEFFVISFSIS